MRSQEQLGAQEDEHGRSMAGSQQQAAEGNDEGEGDEDEDEEGSGEAMETPSGNDKIAAPISGVHEPIVGGHEGANTGSGSHKPHAADETSNEGGDEEGEDEEGHEPGAHTGEHSSHHNLFKMGSQLSNYKVSTLMNGTKASTIT